LKKSVESNRQCRARLAAPTPSVHATLGGTDIKRSDHSTEEKCVGADYRSPGILLYFRCTRYGTKERALRTRGATIHQRSNYPTSTSSDNLLRFGNGLSFEGSIARRVMDGELLAVSLEVPVVFTVDEDVHTHNNPVSPGYRVFFVTPAA
jgi:hypothetical protein